MSEVSQNDIDEIITSIAENHPEFLIDQFKVEFKGILDREPTIKEKQAFQKAVNLLKKDNSSKLLLPVINGYTFSEVLGEGAFGKVYKCEKDGISYAVKRIDKLKMKAAMEQSFADSVSARLNSPFLVRYTDKFRGSSDELYVVMELCTKGDLRKRIDKLREWGAALTEISLAKIMIQLLLALDTLHTNKILHRDLKPENVFADGEDNIKIGDFGCAKELDATNEKVHTIIGTPLYESPQVIKGEEYDSSADMWALGVIMYELCTFERPFFDSNIYRLQQLIMVGEYKKIPQSRCSLEVAEIIHSLLKLNPLERPTARTLLQHPFVKSFADKLSLKKYFPSIVPPNSPLTLPKPTALPPPNRILKAPPSPATGAVAAVASPNDANLAHSKNKPEKNSVAGDIFIQKPFEDKQKKPDLNYRKPDTKPAVDYRPLCKYGAACYQKNPKHLNEFQHPPRRDGSSRDLGGGGFGAGDSNYFQKGPAPSPKNPNPHIGGGHHLNSSSGPPPRVFSAAKKT